MKVALTREPPANHRSKTTVDPPFHNVHTGKYIFEPNIFCMTLLFWEETNGISYPAIDRLTINRHEISQSVPVSNPAPFRVYSMKYAQNHGMFCLTLVFFVMSRVCIRWCDLSTHILQGIVTANDEFELVPCKNGKNYESWGYSYALYPHLFVHMRKYIHDWVCKPGFLFIKTRRYLSRLGHALVNDAFVPHMYIYAHHWLENIDLSNIVMSHECHCVSDRRSRVVEDISIIVIMMTPWHANAFRIIALLCGAFARKWPVMQTFDVCLKNVLCKQSSGSWFQTQRPSGDVNEIGIDSILRDSQSIIRLRFSKQSVN